MKVERNNQEKNDFSCSFFQPNILGQYHRPVCDMHGCKIERNNIRKNNCSCPFFQPNIFGQYHKQACDM